METEALTCCAIREMCSIEYFDSPVDVIRDLCKDIYSEEGMRYMYDDVRDIGGPSAFYIFSGVEGFTGERDCPVGYGSKLATYIRRCGLGTIVESPAKLNRLNHPNHYVKVWTWAPSPTALKAWWGTHKRRR